MARLGPAPLARVRGGPPRPRLEVVQEFPEAREAAVDPDLGQVSVVGVELGQVGPCDGVVVVVGGVVLSLQDGFGARVGPRKGPAQKKVFRDAVIESVSHPAGSRGIDEFLQQVVVGVVPVGCLRLLLLLLLLLLLRRCLHHHRRRRRWRQGRVGGPQQKAAPVLGGQDGDLRAQSVDGIEPLGRVEEFWSEGPRVGGGTGGSLCHLVPVGGVASRIAVLGEGCHVEVNQRNKVRRLVSKLGCRGDRDGLLLGTGLRGPRFW
mmetsp:Transcript_6753/g.13761  ORF Transcript_6753/g.13761 Transcript_6753/m.13761 type:complete len:262 (+) Transcript_6753:1560-2345(+)